MNYVKVANGVVTTSPAPLPQFYQFADGRKTGNFDLLDAAIIAAEGYMPCTDNIPVYDSRLGEPVFSNYTVGASSVTRNYTISLYDLATVKQRRIDEVKNKKYGLLYGGNITYNTNVYFSDESSLQSIAMSAFSASQVGAAWSSVWQLANGSFVTLTQADILALNNAVNTRVLSLRSQAQTNVNAINALTTQLDVVNYTISMS